MYLCSEFSSEWARKKKLACEFSLPPLLLYPRSHELLGWGRGNTAMRWEKRIIDALEILNNIEALKIKLADGTAMLAFGKQIAMTDASIGGRLLPPLFPLAHEVRGSSYKMRAKKLTPVINH